MREKRSRALISIRIFHDPFLTEPEKLIKLKFQWIALFLTEKGNFNKVIPMILLFNMFLLTYIYL